MGWAATGAVALFALAGCGGGGSSGSPSAGTSVTQVALQGTAAVGAPMASANIVVIDSKGAMATTTADSNGQYSVSVTSLTAPLVILASDPTGVDSTQVSVVPSMGTTSTVTANATTLTTAISALLTSTGNPTDLAASSSALAAVTPASVSAAVSSLKTALSTILAANGVGAATFDPIGTPFTADHTGLDGVIDAVQVVAAPGGGDELVSTADATTSVSLNSSANISTTLSAPPVQGGYLSSLVSQLSLCLNGTSTACSQAIDAKYLGNGFTSFASAHPVVAAGGVTLGVPRTLQFFTAGGVQKALVQLPYVTQSGAKGSLVIVVQQLSNGSWDVIGNQQPYNVSISSFLERKQFLDPTEVKFGRYEAGISITVPNGAAGTPNPANLASAAVTGPGINGTVYLTPRAGVGNALLGLTSTALTQPPVGSVLSTSNTSLYRWSWLALGGSANGTFVPGTGAMGYYTPSPIDVSTVPRYATYTVTFYDSTGAQIGQPFSVMNPTPVMPATAGQGVLWQSLSGNTIANFMNPAGSLAAQQASAPIAWSSLINGVNAAPLVGKVQIQATPGTGVNTSEVDGWAIMPSTFAINGSYAATVTAGVDQTGVQQCTSACAFPALQTGASRLVQLYWIAGEIEYFNIWKYND
ncbi:hypothetical protein DWV00_25850 [Trinickia dinghuensis]|uniref:Cell wall anchor protein n=2 Tax=Trinickia dinghuensis TaxID=2291023 RepID=A0A3D8JSQ6_9BURK|nr:hypothetical protein DWV00_25850 [Trinickia dinghuensis]